MVGYVGQFLIGNGGAAHIGGAWQQRCLERGHPVWGSWWLRGDLASVSVEEGFWSGLCEQSDGRFDDGCRWCEGMGISLEDI